MMILLLFAYYIIFFQYAACSPESDLDDRVVKHIFQEDKGRRNSRRAQWNYFNEVGDYGNSEAGFNWNGNNQRKPSRIFRQSDFIFDEDNEFNDVVVPNNKPPSARRISTSTVSNIIRPDTSTVRVPGMATARSACEDTCQATTQFDPVCGDNNVTYTNIYWFRCAQRCGRNISILHTGACSRVP